MMPTRQDRSVCLLEEGGSASSSNNIWNERPLAHGICRVQSTFSRRETGTSSLGGLPHTSTKIGRRRTETTKRSGGSHNQQQYYAAQQQPPYQQITRPMQLNLHGYANTLRLEPVYTSCPMRDRTIEPFEPMSPPQDQATFSTDHGT